MELFETTTEIDRLVLLTEGRSLINESVFQHHRVSHDMIVMMVVKVDHEQSRLRQSYCGVWLVSVTRMSNRPYQTLDNLCEENLLRYGRVS
jgi:hypothetical protein